MIAERFDMLRRHEMTGQLLRFGISGVITTIIYALVYLPLTIWALPRAHAVYAVPPAFVVAVTAGFFLHSRWSFRGRSETADPWRQVKFVAVQGAGVLLNAAVTWIGTAELGYPGWVPLLPAIALATTMTFIINRQLVFR